MENKQHGTKEKKRKEKQSVGEEIKQKIRKY